MCILPSFNDFCVVFFCFPHVLEEEISKITFIALKGVLKEIYLLNLGEPFASALPISLVIPF